jgi:hypothetical protein
MALEETERLAYEAFYLKKIEKELRRWSRSVTGQLESGIVYSTFQIQGNFLDTKRIENTLRDLYQTVGDRFSERTANQLRKIGINAQPLNVSWEDSVDRYFSNDGAKKISTIKSTYEDDIRKVINETVEAGAKEGLALNQITNNVVKNLSGDEWKLSTKFNADRITRTEVGTALNKARFETIEPHKETTLKWWDALPNARTMHALRDQQTRNNPIPIDQPFEGDLMYPQDPRGDVSDVVNCRCVMRLVKKD